MIKQFTRTFHPVGQGAFYTEKIVTDDKRYNIVYDCGSKHPQRVRLEEQIKGAFEEEGDIDLLCISHFHDDHINGIKYLCKHYNIKRVVMPLLDDDAKILIKIQDYAENRRNIDYSLIDNPESYFKDGTQIIKISTGQEENMQNDGVHSIYNGSPNSLSLGSGSRIKVDDEQSEYWYYIPFNYKLTTSVRTIS